jgi:hypothetical protein
VRALFMADQLISFMETDPDPIPGDAIDGLAEILADTPWAGAEARATAQRLLSRLSRLDRAPEEHRRPGVVVAR